MSGSVKSDLLGRRSALFLPASNPRAIAKARASEADMVILDLEDAVKDEDKTRAREAALMALDEDWPMPVAIRLNGSQSEFHAADRDAVKGSKAGLIVLPSVDHATEIAKLADDLAIPVAAMIETPQAVIDAPLIAREAAALVAGTNDLAHGLRLPSDSGRGAMQYALQAIVLAARAAGIAAFDGVCNRLDDPDLVESEAREARTLGFDGKTIIHPNQIAPVHAAFAPSEKDLADAEALVAAFGGGAERFDGRMIEAMHVEAARRLLDRAR